MLSTRMVDLIQVHWEDIAASTIAAIRHRPELKTLSQWPDVELREWCQEVLERLGFLLGATQDEEVQRRFRSLGKLRFEESIPLHEAVLRLHILKDKIIGFIHEQGYPMTAVQLYAEEELEHRLSRLFDAYVYYIVCGYEDAMRIERRIAS